MKGLVQPPRPPIGMRKTNREGRCPFPSHTPGNEYDGTGDMGKGTEVPGGTGRESTNFTVDGKKADGRRR